MKNLMNLKVISNVFFVSLLSVSCGKILTNNKKNEDNKKKNNNTIDYTQNTNGVIKLTVANSTVSLNSPFNLTIQNTSDTNLTLSNINSSPYPVTVVSSTCPSTLSANQSCTINLNFNFTNLYLGSGSTIIRVPYSNGNGSQFVELTVSLSGSQGSTSSNVTVADKFSEANTTALLGGYHLVSDCKNTVVRGQPGTPVLINNQNFACSFLGPHHNLAYDLSNDPIEESDLDLTCPSGWQNYLGSDGSGTNPLVRSINTQVEYDYWLGTDAKVVITGANNADYVPYVTVCSDAEWYGCQTFSSFYARVNRTYCY